MGKSKLKLVIVLLLIPLTVYANIECNDGTISPSCSDCHTGCCSRHGGCTDNPNSSSNENIILDDNNEGEEYEHSDYPSYDENENYNGEEYENYDDTYYSNSKKKESDVSLGFGEIVAIGFGTLAMYGIAKSTK